VYLSKYSDVAGAIIVGTGYVSKITTGFAKFMTRFLAVFQKWDHKSEFIDKLAFNGYNDKIENPKTKFDWLSTNGANVQKYIEDPLCGFTFTLSGFLGLFSIISKACSAKTIKAVKKDLPIFVIAGKEDPVGRYSEGVLDYCDKLEKYGMTKASVTLYAGARHEILNDNCRVQVMDDILNFINKNI
jgi:alpha-beta hydrolase superfamily lysophospholipase